MKFLVNENVPMLSIHRLRDRGLDVCSVLQDSPGATDEAILRALPQRRQARRADVP